MISQKNKNNIFQPQSTESTESHLLKEGEKIKKAKEAQKNDLLFLLTICTPIISFMCALLIMKYNGYFLKNLGISLFFLVFPIVSIIRGINTKKEGHKYKKLLTSGILSLSLLLTMGTLSFFLDDKYVYSNDHAVEACEAIGIEIPPYSSVFTQKMDLKISYGSVGYVCNLQFDKNNSHELENIMKTEEQWLRYIPFDLLPISSPVFHIESTDYTIIHNKTTGEQNLLPKENGTYDFVCVMYDLKLNQMEIVEYQIDYIV
jgi:hypothetical protein